MTLSLGMTLILIDGSTTGYRQGISQDGW